jgi:hypothetical protein
MEKKTPREQLRDSLRENSEHVRQWPDWLRAAISTSEVFAVAPPQVDHPRRDDEPR